MLIHDGLLTWIEIEELRQSFNGRLNPFWRGRVVTKVEFGEVCQFGRRVKVFAK